MRSGSNTKQNRTLSPTKAISRIPSPLIKKTRSFLHTPNEPLPRQPFHSLQHLLCINYPIIKNPVVTGFPNRPEEGVPN
jgi:hypothetical protein